jgi:hypothetical protein
MFIPCWRTILAYSLVMAVAPSFILRAADEWPESPGETGNGRFTIGPEYTIDPDLTDRGKPKGRTFQLSMPLAESRLFNGTDQTPSAKPPATAISAFLSTR